MSSAIPDSIPATWSSVRGVVTSKLLATLDPTGMVLTATVNGDFNNGTPGGVSPWLVGDRLILAGQNSTGYGTGHVENGVYVIASLGSLSTLWQLTRASDARTAANMPNGRQWFVQEEQSGQPSFAQWLSYIAPGKVVGVDPIAYFPSDMRSRNPSVGPNSVRPRQKFPFDASPAFAGIPFVISLIVGPSALLSVEVVAALPFGIQILRTDVWITTAVAAHTVQLTNDPLPAGTKLSGEFSSAALGRVTDTGAGSLTPNSAALSSPIYLQKSHADIQLELCIWAIRTTP